MSSILDNLFLIDFKKCGNVVRFYFGKDKDYTGEDWDDISYYNNAGQVYDEYILFYVDVAFNADWRVYEPADDSSADTNWLTYSKNSMKKGEIPCIIATDIDENNWRADSYKYVLGLSSTLRFYFNMTYKDLYTMIGYTHTPISIIHYADNKDRKE
jgi:hypothetical protein